jgi:hypothetical protein
MREIIYYTGFFVWAVIGVPSVLLVSVLLSWWIIDVVVKRVGMYNKLFDAIWNAAKYRQWKKEQDELSAKKN